MQTRLFHLITVSKQYYVCNEREHLVKFRNNNQLFYIHVFDYPIRYKQEN